MKTLFTAIAILAATFASGSAKANPVDWERPESYLTRSQIQEIARSSSDDETRQVIDSMRVYPINSDLFLVNFHSPQICSISGCSYAIYQQDADGDLDTLFRRSLLEIDSVAVENTYRNGLPCVSLNTTRFCYDGQKYSSDRV